MSNLITQLEDRSGTVLSQIEGMSGKLDNTTSEWYAHVERANQEMSTRFETTTAEVAETMEKIR